MMKLSHEITKAPQTKILKPVRPSMFAAQIMKNKVYSLSSVFPSVLLRAWLFAVHFFINSWWWANNNKKNRQWLINCFPFALLWPEAFAWKPNSTLIHYMRLLLTHTLTTACIVHDGVGSFFVADRQQAYSPKPQASPAGWQLYALSQPRWPRALWHSLIY